MWSSRGILILRYGLVALGGVSSRVMGTVEETCGGVDIEERFDTSALEPEGQAFTALVGSGFVLASFISFAGGEDFSGRAAREVEDVDEACSRAALRFSFPRSTPFLATVVWSLQAKSN